MSEEKKDVRELPKELLAKAKEIEANVEAIAEASREAITLAIREHRVAIAERNKRNQELWDDIYALYPEFDKTKRLCVDTRKGIVVGNGTPEEPVTYINEPDEVGCGDAMETVGDTASENKPPPVPTPTPADMKKKMEAFATRVKEDTGTGEPDN